MASASVCGYINGLQASSITCTTGYCGFNSLYNAAGCCDSTIPLPRGASSGSDSYSLTGCVFTTSCFDSTEVDGSDHNTMDLLCTDPLSPVCGGYTFTDAGYAALFCTDTSTIIEAAVTAADDGGATGGTAAAIASVTEKVPMVTTPAATATSERAGVITSEAGIATSSSVGGGGNPFPNAQGSVGAVGSATMVKANGCARGAGGRVGVVAVVAAVAGVLMGCQGW